MDNEFRRDPEMGFSDYLTLMLIYMKLSGKTNLSWWIVLAPIWGPIALVVSIVGSIVAYNYYH